MSDDNLEKMIVELGAFKTGEFTLASGKKSDYYVDLRVAITRPEFLKMVAERMSRYTGDCDKIAGVELSAVPIAAALALEVGKPFLMVRKKAKEHGTGKVVEGVLAHDDKVVFVEDTATTAGTLVKAILAVREAGGVVDKALIIVDRKEGAAENLAAIGVEAISLIDVDDLR